MPTSGTCNQIAETLIYSTLVSGCPEVSGHVYQYIAPKTAVYPCIIINLQTPRADTMVVGAVRNWSNLLYQVKVVGKDVCFEDIDSVAVTIDNLLHGLSGSDGVLEIVRESPISYMEYDSGVQYVHRGGLYRIQVQA